MSKHEEDWPWRVEPDDLYHILIDTRNLEVNLFWQRTNYFLVLNSAFVLGFFNVSNPINVRIFATLGFLTSLLWVWACLASKYWQTFWQQRLEKFEIDHLGGLQFFSMDKKERNVLVKKGLEDEGLGSTSGFVYRMATRPRSVSFSMLLLAVVFIFGWLTLLVNSFLNPAHP
jgi:hypothetical protein